MVKTDQKTGVKKKPKQSPESAKLSIEELFELRKDKRGLQAFIEDFAEAEEDHKDAIREELSKSAAERLKLSEELDKKKMDEDEKADLEEELNENADEFSEELFDLINDEELETDEKVQKVDALLAKFQKRVERKQKAREKRMLVMDKFNAAKASFIAFVMGLPLFGELSPDLQSKIVSAKDNPEFTPEDLAGYAATLIKKHTGKTVDLEDDVIAKMYADAPKKGAEALAEKADDASGGMVGTALGLKRMLDGKKFAASFGRFGDEIGVSKMIIHSVSDTTVGQLRESVAGVTRESLQEDYGTEEEVERAWQYIQKIQAICEYAEDNEDEIRDVMEEEIERMEGLDKDDETALKALLHPDNLLVSQLAMAMFGDNDIEKNWLVKGSVYVQRSAKFYKTFLGAGAVKAKALNEYFTNTRMRSERIASRTKMSTAISDLKLKSGLDTSDFHKIGDQFDDLAKQIDGVDFTDAKHLEGQHLSNRNRLVDTFQEGVKATEKQFAKISGELASQGKTLDSILARDLTGKTVSQLGLDARSKKVLEGFLGSNISNRSAAKALEQAQKQFATQTHDILKLQSKLNKSIGDVRGQLVTKVIAPFEEISSRADKTLRGTSKIPLRDVKKSWAGNVRYYGPKLAMPIFGVGAALVNGYTGKQGFKKTALMVTEAGISFIPFVGAGMDIGLGWKGYDLAGNKLSAMERLTYVGFGAVGLVADAFGGFLIRGTMAAVVKGRRGMKVVNAVGRRRSLIFKGADMVRKAGHSLGLGRRVEKLDGAIKAKRALIGEIVAKQAAGNASKWETMFRLPKLRKQVASSETKLTAMKKALGARGVTQHGVKGLAANTVRNVRKWDRATMVLERMGMAAGLAFLISKGNVTPVDIVKGAGTVAKHAGSAVAAGYEQVYEITDPPVRSAHEVVAAYLDEKRLERILGDKEGAVVGAVRKHKDSPAARRVAARSGYHASELIGGDSRRKVAESIG